MSREEAIEILEEVKILDDSMYQYNETYLKALEMAINVLKQEPKAEWIPVSEMLPEEGKTVLVCYHSQGGVAQSVCEWFDMPNRGIVWSTLCGQKPIAWMPLPKPYKAGK